MLSHGIKYCLRDLICVFKYCTWGAKLRYASYIVHDGSTASVIIRPCKLWFPPQNHRSDENSRKNFFSSFIFPYFQIRFYHIILRISQL